MSTSALELDPKPVCAAASASPNLFILRCFAILLPSHAIHPPTHPPLTLLAEDGQRVERVRHEVLVLGEVVLKLLDTENDGVERDANLAKKRQRQTYTANTSRGRSDENQRTLIRQLPPSLPPSLPLAYCCLPVPTE